MTIEQITQAVIIQLKKEYHLVPKKQVATGADILPFFNMAVAFVADHLQLEYDQIVSRSRWAKLVKARQFCILLIERNFKGVTTLNLIGDLFQIHHANVIYHKRRAKELMLIDRFFKSSFIEIEKAFTNKIKEEKFNLEQIK